MFKDEAMQFPSNHPQRSYVENGGDDCFVSKDHLLEPQVFYGKILCCSSELPVSNYATRTPCLLYCSSDLSVRQYITTCDSAVHPRAIIVDDFDKCVIWRNIAEDGFKTITAERWRSVYEHVKRVKSWILGSGKRG